MMSVLKKLFAVMLFAAVCATCSAAPWTAFGPKRKPVTLLITANYVSPRALAELVQYESGQPFLLLPAANDTNQSIIFCPREKKDAYAIPEAHLNRFIKMLDVKRIIVLGNTTYVPQKYIDLLDHHTPIMRSEGKDWYRIAEELNFMLNLSNLDKNFRKIRSQLVTEDKLYRPLRNRQTQTPAQAPADKTIDAAAQSADEK